MKITLQYFDGCPSWQETERLLADLVQNEPDIFVTLERVETAEDAERLGFRGSPSVLLDGQDAFPDPSTQIGLACRRYQTPDGPKGSPTRGQLARVLAPHLTPLPPRP